MRPVSVMPLGGYGQGYSPALVSGPPGAPPSMAPGLVGGVTAQIVTVGAWQRSGAAIGVLGAAMLAFGTFVPWATVDMEGFGARTGNGWRNVLGGTGWGPLILGLALVIAVGLAAPLARVRPGGIARVAVGASVLAVLAVGVQFVEILRPHDEFDVQIGMGLFVLLSGALLALVGSLLAAGSGRPANVSAPRAVGAVG
jgi:hypothetical protein